MALSRKEKNGIRKSIGEYLTNLDSSDISRKEKNNVRREIGALLVKLEAAIDLKPEAIENEKLKALVAGDYNDKPVPEFLVIMDEIVTEIGAIEPVKQPAIAYGKANKDKIREDVQTTA